MNQDFKELLAAFARSSARFLIIGGYAVMKHTEPRYTKDLDIWIASDAANTANVYAALLDFGAPIQGLKPSDFSAPGYYFTMGTPPNQVDIWIEIPGVEFESCWNRRVQGSFLDLEVDFISREDLIINKEEVGRLQDLADAEKLRQTS